MLSKLSSGLIGLLLLAAPLAHAFEPTTQKVTDNVYAIIGELDQRSADNQGLNNTTGFIITADGVRLSSAIGGKPEDLQVEYASETFEGDEKP
ncbi:adhesin HecA family 20-residue repeat-containing protein [Thiothrix caldifontis]|uniref:Adhesin HecA family 20-residue repeat-containing protein n=1 Tax=Thiothrix caldifontis TaxID=525918 RepID=A0A1H4GFE9_9GAMM|nr:hypothetical protein [Thiothrix caldifontis]SEB08309.1 adhesin HecA family 20-residue repeat-containing protein [Thiothrix caldifontis]